VSQVFAEPAWLALLVASLIAAIGIARGSARRRVHWRSLGMAADPPPTGVWSWWFASLFLILALAAPRWGRVPGSELPPGHDVVFLVDVSRSMAAEDAVPDRLGLAKVAARSLIDQLRQEPGDRAALVAFSGRAVARCPLTEDLDAVLDCLLELRPGMIEPGGTDLGAGLAAALDVFDAQEHAEGRSIVVFSDGEDHANAWAEMVGRLVAAEVVVHVVAIGDLDKDHPVPSPSSGSPSSSSVNPVMTRRNDAALTQLAHATGGAIVPLGVASGDLGALYRDQIEPTSRGQRPEPRFSERAERYSVCLTAALVAGLLGTWPPSRRHRGRSFLGARRDRGWGRLLLVVAVTILLIFGSLAAAPGPPRIQAQAASNRGLQAFQEGRFADALAAFEDAITARPDNPIGRFNAGSALFSMGCYLEASARYAEARGLADRALMVKVDYALGNCEAMTGDFPGAVRHYDACLASTDPRAAFVAVRRDAAINRAFALEQITPPPDDPNGDDPGNSGKGPGGKSGEGKPPNPDPNRTGGDPPSNPDGPRASTDGGSSGRRGPGGAGGSGAALPESGSPEGRLDAALRRIRAAKERRSNDSPPIPRPPAGGGSGKDW